MKKVQVLTALAIALAAVGAQAAPMAAVAPKAPVATPKAPTQMPSVSQSLSKFFAPGTTIHDTVVANQNVGGTPLGTYFSRTAAVAAKQPGNAELQRLTSNVAGILAKADLNGDKVISLEELAKAKGLVSLAWVAASVAESGVALPHIVALTEEVLGKPANDTDAVLADFAQNKVKEEARGSWDDVSKRIVEACAVR